MSSVSDVSADSSIIYVNDSSGNDDWDGQYAEWQVGTLFGPKKSIKNATGTVTDGGIINIADGTYTGVNNTNITINKNMTLNGQSRDGTIINGTDSAQLFVIQDGLNVTIQNLTLANGRASSGGAIYNNYGTILTIKDTIFIGNTANSTDIFSIYGGGAIYNRQGTLNIENSTFTSNTAYREGGAILNWYGTSKIANSIFTSNIANDAHGGAIYHTGTLTLINSIFTGNIARYGGAIYNDYESAFNFEGCILNITNSTFISNKGNVHGGAIYNDRGTATVINSIFTENIAGYGGAIINMNNLTVNNSIFNSNHDNAISNSGTLTVNNNVFKSNTANCGGAISNAGTLIVNGSDFTDNYAINYGGAIYSLGASMDVHFSRFIGNIAYSGKDIYGIGSADYNWWGSNVGPAADSAAYATVNSWLVLTVNTNSTLVKANGISAITADLLHDNQGNYHDPTLGHVFDGIIVNFNTNLGSINSPSPTVNGIAQSNLNGGSVNGVANVSAALDSQIMNILVTVDATAPTVHANSTGGLFNTSQSVLLTANDNLDSNPVIYYTTDGVNWYQFTGSGTVLISNECTTSLEFYAVDAAGNPSVHTTYIYTIDKTAPIVTGTPADVSLSKDPINVVLSSEIDAIIYYTTDGINWYYFTGSGTVPINDEGITSLEFYAVDAAGNPSVHTTYSYMIDKTAPIVNATPTSSVSNSSINVNLSSEIGAIIYYRTNAGSWNTFNSNGTVSIINVGATTLEFYAVDAAGNPSPVYTVTYTIKLIPIDLKVESVTTSGNTATGVTNYPVTALIKNYGSAVQNTFYVSYYLSKDTTKSGDDRYIGHATINGLAGGSSINTEILASIPKDIAQGNYYIIAVADVTGVVPESNEANNIKTSASSVFVWRPDLRINLITTSGNIATGVSNYTVTGLIQNYGSAVQDTFYVSYYLSKDTTKSGDDRYIGHATVNGLNGWSSANAQFNCTIPKDIAQGNYYIIAVADVTGVVPESNEANNIKTSASSVFMWRPDLRVNSVITSGNTVAGAINYTVTSSIQNSGSITKDTFYVSYYLSTDASKSSNDRYIGHATVNGLNGWSTTNAQFNCTISSDIAQGYYYIIAVADVTGVIPESNEANNIKTSASRIYITRT